MVDANDFSGFLPPEGRGNLTGVTNGSNSDLGWVIAGCLIVVIVFVVWKQEERIGVLNLKGRKGGDE